MTGCSYDISNVSCPLFLLVGTGGGLETETAVSFDQMVLPYEEMSCPKAMESRDMSTCRWDSEFIVEIARPSCLSLLDSKRANGRIKVITGIRRCGKTYILLRLFPVLLESRGVSPDHTITVDLEDYANRALRDSDALYEYVSAAVPQSGGTARCT